MSLGNRNFAPILQVFSLSNLQYESYLIEFTSKMWGLHTCSINYSPQIFIVEYEMTKSFRFKDKIGIPPPPKK